MQPSDPLHVIPSCAIGAATAGALSMAFHCGLRAPHGGIFVFPCCHQRPDVLRCFGRWQHSGRVDPEPAEKEPAPKSNPLNPDFLNFNFLPRWGAALPPLPGLFCFLCLQKQNTAQDFLAIPHNSKCRYGERGAADAKPKAQIILDAAKVSAASGGKQRTEAGAAVAECEGLLPRSTMRVPQPDIIEHFGNADAVPQLPERA